ncbi:hypothetical protein RHA1_ro00552 [Rhodococcus jostii RHA1]|jgi:hypothetical protein|uniref:Uncharacterized protein n=1 Tax=Rhodococcus jostii (strain RHA1) TaxID=101510 RepID=Q0SJ99_RHOJR|nr:hypothetical protein [Rhodococcus jostii]ABG92387.1 hypothetical protein RHA1_ro00552 [Rhodococcus jostii RHA1]
MSTTQLHPNTHPATSTSHWKRLATAAAATAALGLVPVAAANATTAPPNATQPAAAVTHDSPLDRDNDIQQQHQHDRQRDQRQDRRADTIVLDQILLDG